MTPAAYRGRKATHQNIKEIKTSSINHHYPFIHSVTVDFVEEVPLTPQPNDTLERAKMPP